MVISGQGTLNMCEERQGAIEIEKRQELKLTTSEVGPKIDTAGSGMRML